jgi:RNA polymerase sigma-70 factor, ECF subfamily
VVTNISAPSPDASAPALHAEVVAAPSPALADRAPVASRDLDDVQSLWRDHRRWVAAILLAHKPAWADLDDLLQDVATSVVRKVRELRDPQALKPWLRTVAVNVAHAAARKGKRAAAFASLEGVETQAPMRRGEGDPADDGAHPRSTQEGGRLLALAQQLPDGYREPLLLKAVQGMSYRQIGQVLGLPETTIETRIARGRKMLRELAERSEPARDLSAASGGSKVP